MNDQENKIFDDLLRSKLSGHVIQPQRDLMPDILDKIGSDGGGGGTSSFMNNWPYFVLGLAFLGTLGYFMMKDGGQSTESSKDLATITASTVSGDNGDQNTSSAQTAQLGPTKTDQDANNGITSSNSGQEAVDLAGDLKDSDNDQQNVDVASEVSTPSNALNKNNSVAQNNAVHEVIPSELDKTEKTVAKSAKSTTKKEAAANRSVQQDVIANNSTSIDGGSVNNSTGIPNEKESIKDILSREEQVTKKRAQIEEEVVASANVVEKQIEKSAGSADDVNIKSLEANANNAEGAIIDKNNGSIEEVEANAVDNAPENTSTDLNKIDSPPVNNSNEVQVETNDILSSSESEPSSSDISSLDSNENVGNNQIGESSENVPTEPVVELSNDAVEESASNAEEIVELAQTSKKWSIDIMAGPSYNFRMLDAPVYQELVEHKNENESSMTTYLYSGRLRRKIIGNLNGDLGFMFLRVGEKYEFSNDIASHSSDNIYTYYSVPFGLEYLFMKHRKFNLNVGIGGQVNFLQKGNSSWLDPQSFAAQTHSNDDPGSPFNERTFAWNARIGLRYPISDKFDFILEEHGMLFKDSVYKKETGMNQREYSFRTFIGLGLKF